MLQEEPCMGKNRATDVCKQGPDHVFDFIIIIIIIINHEKL